MHFGKNKSHNSAVRKAAAKALRGSGFEPLEQRQLMSVSFNGSYSQNFDTLTTSTSATTWTNDSTLPGWSLFINKSGFPAAPTILGGNGSSNTGSFFSFGTNSDRALGSVGSGGAYWNSPANNVVGGWIASSFTNTGNAASQFTFSYDGEQWRNGGNATPQTMAVQYGFGATFATVPTWTNSSAGFTTPTVGATAATLDGNAAANRTAGLTQTVTGINWASGQTLWFRWVEVNDAGNDHGMGVDNFSLTTPNAPPNPGTLTIASKVVNEDAGTVSLTISRVGGTLGAVSADILVNDGTAVSGNDYGQPNVNSVSFANGDSTAKTITIPIIDDTKYELTEQFLVGLTNATGTSGAPTLGIPGTVTINDNDTPFYKNSFETPEGDPNAGYTFNGGATGDFKTTVGTTTDIAYFNRFASPDTVATGRKDFTSGFDGSFAIQGQNTSDDAFADGANPDRTISITPIDITGKTDLTAFVSLGADVSSGTFKDWTSTDGSSIFANIDGNSTKIAQFKPSDSTGSALLLDTNFDGIGDGPSLTEALQDFAFSIPGTGHSLSIDIVATSTGGFRAYAIDNVRVDGTQAAAPTLPAWVASGSDATWDAGTSTLTVTGDTTITADPGASGDLPLISATGATAHVTIAPTDGSAFVHLGGLDLENGATANVSSLGAARTHDNHEVLVLGTLTGDAPIFAVDAANGSKLDLEDNDMIIHNSDGSGASGAFALAAIGRGVAPGGVYDGTWTGNGLTSSAAASADASGVEANILAVELNSQRFFLGQFSEWDIGSQHEELRSDGNDVLVKYTYNGDVALEGKTSDNSAAVLGTFYDGGASTGNSFTFGDMNGDGKIDDNDSAILGTLYGLGTGGDNGELL